jgi:hypothetical protein
MVKTTQQNNASMLKSVVHHELNSIVRAKVDASQGGPDRLTSLFTLSARHSA